MVEQEQEKKETDRLLGIGAICKFMGKTESTIIQMVRDEEFPAVKNGAGVYEVSKKKIETWKRKQAKKK